jgi:glycosyltransferase involved in cell wall biosynthesis
VVDDGSSDNGPAAVRALQDARISCVSQVNQGVSAARNHGIALARGELVALLDADDIWQPDFLATVAGLARDFPEAGWFATGYRIQYPDGAPHDNRLRGIPAGFQRGILRDYFQVAMQSDPPVCSSTVAFRRAAIDKVGGFPKGVASGEDLLTWARLAIAYPLAYACETLATFHASGISRAPDCADPVGLALSSLARNYPDQSGLPAYVGLWFRMQAVKALRLGDRPTARSFAWKATWAAPNQWRNPYTLVLAWLPACLSARLDAWLRRLTN